MRALVYSATGPADEVLSVRDLPDPQPGAGDVLVRVHASGINPADVKRRGGWNGMEMAHDLVIPHCDGAGVIEAVGAEVDPARVGERVWMWNAQGGYGERGRAFGTAAELIALPAVQAVRLPASMSFAQGACMGVPGLTAWLLVLSDGPIADRTILVQGAAGAVGQMVVQMALHHGARPIAVVSSDAGAAHVATVGDVPTLNRHTEDVVDRVRALTGGEGVDRIVEVDLGANLAVDIACLAPHGTIASYSSSSDPTPVLPYYDLANLGATIRFIQGFRLTAQQRVQAERTLTDMANAGTLIPPVAAIFSLSDAAKAHRRVEARALGQTVLMLIPSDEGSDHE